jgi:multicomponent Na+:H+ antiporter subunit C
MVSQWTLYASAGVAVVAIALHGLFTREGVLRRIIAANLLGGGVFLIMVALANRAPEPIADPVLHALVLTGIVISVSATALGLAIARRLADADRDDGAGDAPHDDGDAPHGDRGGFDGDDDGVGTRRDPTPTDWP